MRTASRPPLLAARSLFIIAVAAPPAAGGDAAAAATPEASVELWVRKAGSNGLREAGDKSRPQRFDLDTLALEEAEVRDVQYGDSFHYKGIRLKTLIAKYAPPAETDLALLHFANGMLIPLPFRDERVMKRLAPFLARQLVEYQGLALSPGVFPALTRTRENSVEVKPIEFEGNKLAVAERWHPMVPDNARPAFAPWVYADMLVEIEFVKAAAWYARFDLDPETHQGFEVFRGTCQYCHGARQSGAGYGWDFVSPEPIVSHRKTEASLYFHVHYRAATEQMRGVQMPALAHITEEDAKQIHAWLKVLAAREMTPYTP